MSERCLWKSFDKKTNFPLVSKLSYHYPHHTLKKINWSQYGFAMNCGEVEVLCFVYLSTPREYTCIVFIRIGCCRSVTSLNVFSILAKVCFFFVLMAVFIKWGANFVVSDLPLFWLTNCFWTVVIVYFFSLHSFVLVTKVLKKKDFKWYLVEDRGKKSRCTFLGKQLQALELVH